jgi:hypothetical protein
MVLASGLVLIDEEDGAEDLHCVVNHREQDDTIWLLFSYTEAVFGLSWFLRGWAGGWAAMVWFGLVSLSPLLFIYLSFFFDLDFKSRLQYFECEFLVEFIQNMFRIIVVDKEILYVQ